MQPNPMPRFRRGLKSAYLERVWGYCSAVAEQKPYKVTGEGSVVRILFDPH